MTDRQPNVFLSYSHKDRDIVEEIRAILTANGITIKWDRDFEIGNRWEPQMQQNLRDAEAVVICWSQNSAGSSVVNHEYSIADYENKQIGIALEDGIEFKGIAGAAHHERYYEWQPHNRDERIKVLTDRIKEIARFRHPEVSMERILDFVRRIDREPQAGLVESSLAKRLSARDAGCVWLVTANRFERPGEFAIRIADQLIPEALKVRGIISDANDEKYESELYKLKWPRRYVDADEAVRSIITSLKDRVPGYVDAESPTLGECLQATESIALTIYLEVPLGDYWNPGNEEVLKTLLEEFSKVEFDASRPKYFAVFVAAKYDNESDKSVGDNSASLFGRMFGGGKKEIGDIFGELARNNGAAEPMPELPMISRQAMDDWCDAAELELKIPDEEKNYFKKAIYEPYSKDSSGEHYQVLAAPMQEALEVVLHGKKQTD